MKKKKKVIKICSVFVSMVLILSIFSTCNIKSAKAYSSSEKVISQKKEITDISKLYARAVNGISDIPKGDLKPTAQLVKESEDKHYNSLVKTTEKPKVYLTAQVLKTTEKNNQETSEIAVTSFVVVNEQSTATSANVVMPMTSNGGSQSDSKWDKTGGVKAYSTIHYKYSHDSNGVKLVKLTSASGGWSINDSHLD